MSDTVTTSTSIRPLADVRSRLLAGAFAAALGVVVIFVAGFAPHAGTHNAAHDSRHSFAFPCH